MSNNWPNVEQKAPQQLLTFQWHLGWMAKRAGKHEMISMIAPRDLLLCEALGLERRSTFPRRRKKKRNYEMKETESRSRLPAPLRAPIVQNVLSRPKSHRSWVDTKNFSLTKYQRIHKRKKKGKLHQGQRAINQAARAFTNYLRPCPERSGKSQSQIINKSHTWTLLECFSPHTQFGALSRRKTYGRAALFPQL